MGKAADNYDKPDLGLGMQMGAAYAALIMFVFILLVYLTGSMDTLSKVMNANYGWWWILHSLGLFLGLHMMLCGFTNFTLYRFNKRKRGAMMWAVKGAGLFGLLFFIYPIWLEPSKSFSPALSAHKWMPVVGSIFVLTSIIIAFKSNKYTEPDAPVKKKGKKDDPEDIRGWLP